VDVFEISGGGRLAGDVTITGAKNSVLKVMAAALLAEGTTTLSRVPDIVDVPIMSEILRGLGAEVTGHAPQISISVPAEIGFEADYEHVRRIRGSVCVLGPLLARTGRARVALPGGDAIGSRGLDLHIMGLERLGASFDNAHGYLVAEAPKLSGAQIWLDFPSVGATENILMAAVLAEGTTLIDNAAREPEIEDLAAALAAMGVPMEGAGSTAIRIQGVTQLRGIDHEVIADRIEAGTFLVAGAITGGDCRVRGARAAHLDAFLQKLEEAGIDVDREDGAVRVRGAQRPRSVDVKTAPFPGFATDLQAQMMVLMAVAQGSAMITETIFENRFMHALELIRLGADIAIEGNHAVVRGVERLSGAPVMATDLRASVSLILAGLAADDTTEIRRVYHLDRGYERIEAKLSALGADIRREKAAPE